MSEHPEIPVEQWPVVSPSPKAANGASPQSPQSPHLSDELLAAWAADELARDERSAVQRHLESCASCQHALEQTQRIRALVRATADETAPSRTTTSAPGDMLAHLPGQPGRMPSEKATYETPGVYHAPTPMPSSTRNQRRDTWRRFAALAAVLLLIASSALIFSRISARGQTNTTIATATATPALTPTTTATFPGNWAKIVPAQATIQDVAAVSPHDIWAAGLTGTDHGIETLLMHYDGTRWQVSPDTFDGAQLYSISMVSATDGWAAGSNNGAPFMLHYTGGHWRDATTSVDTNALLDHKIILTHVRMATATSGWALGQGDQQPQQSTQMLQYLKAGTTYRWEPTESLQGVVLKALSVVSDHEAWMIGANGQKTIIVRVTTVYLNNDPGSTVTNWYTNSWDVGNGSLTSISMSSSADGWTGGVDSRGEGALFHWDGQQWRQTDALSSQQYTGAIQGIVMSGPNTGWVYSQVTATNGSFLFSLANGRWTDTHAPSNLRIVCAAAISPSALLVITDHPADDGAHPTPALYNMQESTPPTAP